MKSLEERLKDLEVMMVDQTAFNEQLVELITVQGETIAQLKAKESLHQETASKLEILMQALSNPLSLLSGGTND